VSLWDRIRGVGPEGERARAARRLEEAGDLGGAVDAYLEAELGDEASRVLLLRADTEPSLEKRVAHLERAARVASDPEAARKARARRARLSFDLVRARGAAARSEVDAAAKELEAVGEHLAAAEAYALIGDKAGEVRALTAAGAVDELEDRLRDEASETKEANAIALARSRVADLDASGERLAALALARETLARSSDGRIEDLARAIRHRLVRTPIVSLAWEGERARVAFGDEVTIGRGEATIVVPSRAVSRVHLRLRRASGVIVAEDTGTRNGTLLAGARLGGAVPVGPGLSLVLGGGVAVDLAERRGGVEIAVAGDRYFAPLGPLFVGPWAVVQRSGPDGAPVTVLESTSAGPAFLGVLEAARAIELAYGDAVSITRGGPATLEVGAKDEPA
jgi:hypothetical protein